jgi:hypothetical protein
MRQLKAAFIAIVVGIGALGVTGTASAADTGWTVKTMYDLPNTDYPVGTVNPQTDVTLVCWTDTGSTRWFRLTAPTYDNARVYIGEFTDFMPADDVSNQYDVPAC